MKITRTIEAEVEIISTHDIPFHDDELRWAVRDEYGFILHHYSTEQKAIDAVNSGSLDPTIFDLK